MIFSSFLSAKLEFIIGWCLRGGQVSPSIRHQTLLRCNLHDPRRNTGWKPPRCFSLLSSRILNHFSEYKITLQTLRDSPWNPLPPPLLPPNTGLHSASEGDHLSLLVNVSWSSLRSSLCALSAGRTGVRGCVGRDVVFIYVEPCCEVLSHVATQQPAACGGSSSRCLKTHFEKCVSMCSSGITVRVLTCVTPCKPTYMNVCAYRQTFVRAHSRLTHLQRHIKFL